MSDKRRAIPKLSPPRPRGGPSSVHAYLSPEDYRLYYEVVMTRGISGSETLRQLIREEAARLSLT